MPPFSSASPRSVMETWPHALPYRVIFEEQRARRGPEFVALLQKWATPPTGVEPIVPIDAEQLLESALQRVAEVYAGLEERRAYLREACRKRCNSPEQRKQVLFRSHKAVDDAAIECQTADIPLKRLLHLCGSSAVCFSGGGMRSASFSLGILQGLARFSLAGSPENGFLHRLHYLSTVSGGGYTGSWLMGWARRSSFSTAVEELGSAGKTAGDPEPDPISYLRDYTSFLAPHYGFTVDTATLATIVVRNLFLNWLIFLPCLMVLILVPRVLAMASSSIAAWIINLPPYAEYSLMWAAMLLIAVAGCITAYRDWQTPRTLNGQSAIFRSRGRGGIAQDPEGDGINDLGIAVVERGHGLLAARLDQGEERCIVLDGWRRRAGHLDVSIHRTRSVGGLDWNGPGLLLRPATWCIQKIPFEDRAEETRSGKRRKPTTANCGGSSLLQK